MNDQDIGGWLRRRGQKLHTWSKRWFVLHDKSLMMFSKDGDKKCLDTINLDKQTLSEPTTDPADPKAYFDIVTGNETICLCADTIEEKQTWMRALKRALYADKGGALFCQSLDEILFWEKISGRRVPYIVDECVQYLYKYGLDVEGIFRLGGRLVIIKEVICRFEKGEKIEFEKEETDVHVVASVLKAFLRDLPDSIIPCQHYQKFMNIALRFMDAKEDEKQPYVEDLVKAMDLIPDDNYIILEYVCNFLKKVSQHGDKNKMTMMNIGTIFGNNIIRHIDKENSQLLLCTADLGQNLVFMLLNYLPQVFSRQQTNDNKDVATADLLHISEDAPVASIPPPSQPTISEDLQGLDLTGSFTSETSQSSNGSMKVVEDFYSQPNSKSNSLENANKLGDKKRSFHLSLKKKTWKDHTENSGPSSPSSTSPEPPIPPRRNRLMRNRPLSEKSRPRGVVSQNIEPPSLSPQSPVSGNFQTPPETPTQLTDSQSSDQPFDNAQSIATDVRAGEYLPTYEELLAENKRLKVDIAVKKERYKKDVSALTSQLTNINQKYDQRIKTMETTFNNRKTELETKAAQEKKSATAAKNDVLKLREELKKYQLTYGELPKG